MFVLMPSQFYKTGLNLCTQVIFKQNMHVKEEGTSQKSRAKHTWKHAPLKPFNNLFLRLHNFALFKT